MKKLYSMMCLVTGAVLSCVTLSDVQQHPGGALGDSMKDLVAACWQKIKGPV